MEAPKQEAMLARIVMELSGTFAWMVLSLRLSGSSRSMVSAHLDYV